MSSSKSQLSDHSRRTPLGLDLAMMFELPMNAFYGAFELDVGLMSEEDQLRAEVVLSGEDPNKKK